MVVKKVFMLNKRIIEGAEAKEKQYKLLDGRGLHLLIMPNGSKYWQMRYRFGGKEKLLSIGTYPAISLDKAREEAFNARLLIPKAYV
jgi:hypothetical protein